MSAMRKTASSVSIGRHLRVGVTIVALVAGGVGGWAATTEIAGAVVASGALVVDSNVKKVQHPNGGIIGEILARNGDRVEAGQVVARLDSTLAVANLAIIRKRLTEAYARKARLEAERDGLDTIALPDELVRSAADPMVANVIEGEQKLFTLRRTARLGQKDQLRQRIEQAKQEIEGLTAQVEAKTKEIELISRELQGARELWKKNLMPITKLTQLEREATRITGERGQLVSTIARAGGAIAEIELQIGQIDRDLASEVARELAEVDARIGETVERKIAAEDQLKRIDIIAPQAGTVHQSAVNTVGGVINAGEVIMLIVPSAEGLAAEVRVLPQDIDQVRNGLPAMLRFAVFNQRTTPELNGTVSRIAADVTTEERSGISYYTTRIALPESEIARLGDVTLVPGMPVEVFIKTGERTVISYLTKPLADQLAKAFRER
jgi:HlyD family secretion protein